jgi:predicted DNA-binding antitoxin AbrB/MazE fold protein
MAVSIEAVYDEGVFRPTNPVALRNGTVVEITVRTKGGTIRGASSPDEVNRYLDDIAARCQPSDPEEPFSGQDHDEILYGTRGAR